MTPGELAEAIKPLMEQASHEIAVDVAHYWRELVAAVTTRRGSSDPGAPQ
jgi:hypothetical protein